eukprot:TRINITY_DN3832_c0_g1_i1.p1 TRINITY_DN3832_c0_g1~~TRINITY_DN3832_c0_g1_i1.p1  ORF type:complete len:1249 (+),score=331.87 TRINITY_DN3832_c0_g1_i1:36-3782(+)
MLDTRRVWVTDSTRGWDIYTVKSELDKGILVVENDEKKDVRVNKNSVIDVNNDSLHTVDDMISLPELHEPIILHNLKERYSQDQIYTYIGPMIVSMNPFKSIKGLYGVEKINAYRNKRRETSGLPPHIFAISEKSFTNIVENNESQSILISGESGAGKTEAAKYIMRYLSHAATGESDQAHTVLSVRLLASNPILEAFGNAKTLLNENSSRFGKFIHISLSPQGIYQGASIKNYLLEKTRVVYQQPPTERNYHIFYQLLKGLSPDERINKYHLRSDSPSAYKYLSNGEVQLMLADDVEDFKVLIDSFDKLAITKDEVESFFSLVAGILHLGNVQFGGDHDSVKIVNEDAVECAAKLFCVPPNDLKKVLVTRTIETAMDKIIVPLRMDQAIENRDGMAKALYAKMFDKLVMRINAAIAPEHETQASATDADDLFIGVLDIYGFEIFEKNSLEQFCINYANEKLHQQFIENMFKAEQAEYAREGIAWNNVDYVDNQDCISLIEKPAGILRLIDEESTLPKGSNQSLATKLHQNLRGEKAYVLDERNKMTFGIKHYAANVKYSLDVLMERNKDTMSDDVVRTMQSSTDPFMAEIFPSESDGRAKSPWGGSGPSRTTSISRPTRKETVCRKFQTDLQQLVNVLARTSRHYVRCIKPNDKSTSENFIGQKVVHQLRSNGILETVKLRKSGFNRRMGFKVFHERFHYIGCSGSESQGISKFLSSRSPVDDNMWAIGKTMIFLRENLINVLEDERVSFLKKHVLVVQSYVRQYYAQCILQELVERKRFLVNRIQNMVRVYNAKVLYSQLLNEHKVKIARITSIQSSIRRYYAVRKLERLRDEHQIKIQRITLLQSYIRSYNSDKQFQVIKFVHHQRLLKSSKIIQNYVRSYNAKQKLHNLRVEHIENEKRKERERLEKEREKQEKEEQERERQIAEQRRAERERERLLQQQQQLQQPTTPRKNTGVLVPSSPSIHNVYALEGDDDGEVETHEVELVVDAYDEDEIDTFTVVEVPVPEEPVVHIKPSISSIDDADVVTEDDNEDDLDVQVTESTAIPTITPPHIAEEKQSDEVETIENNKEQQDFLVDEALDELFVNLKNYALPLADIYIEGLYDLLLESQFLKKFSSNQGFKLLFFYAAKNTSASATYKLLKLLQRIFANEELSKVIFLDDQLPVIFVSCMVRILVNYKSNKIPQTSPSVIFMTYSILSDLPKVFNTLGLTDDGILMSLFQFYKEKSNEIYRFYDLVTNLRYGKL